MRINARREVVQHDLHTLEELLLTVVHLQKQQREGALTHDRKEGKEGKSGRKKDDSKSMVWVSLVAGRDLLAADMLSSDPYCWCWIDTAVGIAAPSGNTTTRTTTTITTAAKTRVVNDRTSKPRKKNERQHKTKKINSTLYPQWNDDSMYFPLNTDNHPAHPAHTVHGETQLRNKGSNGNGNNGNRNGNNGSNGNNGNGTETQLRNKGSNGNGNGNGNKGNGNKSSNGNNGNGAVARVEMLNVHVYDHDTLTAHDSLGMIRLALTPEVLQHATEKDVDVWCALQPDPHSKYSDKKDAQGNLNPFSLSSLSHLRV